VTITTTVADLLAGRPEHSPNSLSNMLRSSVVSHGVVALSDIVVPAIRLA